MSDYDMKGPTLVGYQVTGSLYGYIKRALELGVVEGPLGDMKPPPEVAEIVRALNHVLAGGKVEVKVTSRGNPDIVNELNGRLEQAQKDANEINEKAGYYVTAVA